MALIAFVALASKAEAKIDAGDLKQSTTATVDFAAAPNAGTGGTALCPAGTKVFSGGAFWYETGSPDPAPTITSGLTLTGSSPNFQGSGWYADGRNASGDGFTLRVIARCLPEQKLDSVVTKVKTLNVPNGEVVDKELECFRGTRVISGGAYWHDVGSSTSPQPAEAGDGSISSSTPLSARSWYVSAFNGPSAIPAAREDTISARCLVSRKLTKYKKVTSLSGLSAGGSSLATNKCKGAGRAGPAGIHVSRPGKNPRATEADRSYLLAIGVVENTRSFVGGMRVTAGSFLDVERRAYCLQ